MGTSNVRVGLVDFKGSFSILEAKQELMAFPVLLLDWESLLHARLCRGQQTLQAESRMLPASVLFSCQWKRTRFLLAESGKTGAFYARLSS